MPIPNPATIELVGKAVAEVAPEQLAAGARLLEEAFPGIGCGGKSFGTAMSDGTTLGEAALFNGAPVGIVERTPWEQEMMLFKLAKDDKFADTFARVRGIPRWQEHMRAFELAKGNEFATTFEKLGVNKEQLFSTALKPATSALDSAQLQPELKAELNAWQGVKAAERASTKTTGVGSRAGTTLEASSTPTLGSVVGRAIEAPRTPTPILEPIVASVTPERQLLLASPTRVEQLLLAPPIRAEEHVLEKLATPVLEEPAAVPLKLQEHVVEPPSPTVIDEPIAAANELTSSRAPFSITQCKTLPKSEAIEFLDAHPGVKFSNKQLKAMPREIRDSVKAYQKGGLPSQDVLENELIT